MREIFIMYTIQRITEENKSDIHLLNEPFKIWGRMTPLFDGKAWSYQTKELPQDKQYEMCFPDFENNYDEMKSEYFFAGAYDGQGTCIGLAVYKNDWFDYLYLDDLKVNGSHRGHGIGKMLIEEGKKIALENGYHGIYTIGQDNNLSADLFYLKNGFEIGGFNTQVYKGTKQEGKSDIYFYLDIE